MFTKEKRKKLFKERRKLKTTKIQFFPCKKNYNKVEQGQYQNVASWPCQQCGVVAWEPTIAVLSIIPVMAPYISPCLPDSTVMMSGNSPFISKTARYNFLSRSGHSGFQHFAWCHSTWSCLIFPPKNCLYISTYHLTLTHLHSDYDRLWQH